MTIKQFLVLSLVVSWFWLLGGLAPEQASAAAPEETSPQIDEKQQDLPPGTGTQAESETTETNQLRPLGVSPDNSTEPDQKLCESREVIVAYCEPVPGSPLSAFPLSRTAKVL